MGSVGALSGQIVLRDVIEADLPLFFEHQRDPSATRMAAFPARDREAFMSHWATILADPTVTTKSILLGDAVAGNIVSFDQSGKRLVGYWLGREFWGMGVATKALTEFVAQVSCRPLCAIVAKHNVGSIRVLQKSGFVLSGEDLGPALDGGDPVEELFFSLEN